MTGQRKPGGSALCKWSKPPQALNSESAERVYPHAFFSSSLTLVSLFPFSLWNSFLQSQQVRGLVTGHRPWSSDEDSALSLRQPDLNFWPGNRNPTSRCRPRPPEIIGSQVFHSQDWVVGSNHYSWEQITEQSDPRGRCPCAAGVGGGLCGRGHTPSAAPMSAMYFNY